MYKLGLWGQYGDGGKIADGQAVRTTIITELLKDRYGTDNVLVLNTNQWKKHPIKFFWDTVSLYFRSEQIIIFPADKGFEVVVTIYQALRYITRRSLHDVVIGGFLPDLLKASPKYVKALKKYKALYVQTPQLQEELRTIGLNNVYILSNLKIIKPVAHSIIKLNDSRDIKLCCMCRICETKGINDAIEAVLMANKKLGGDFIKLDCFGLMDREYEPYFNKLVSENPGILSYSGIIPYNETVNVLQDYFALLFPTYYHGEGFPGCIIDAYFSGRPIIATDWKYNRELVFDESNGLIVPIKSPEKICEAILKLYNDRKLHYSMSIKCLEESQKYTPERVMKELYRNIEE